jgi:hypothetical protein
VPELNASLETEVDQDLHQLKGADLNGIVGANLDKRGPGSRGTRNPAADQPAPVVDNAERRGAQPPPLTWGDLQCRNPEWLGEFWEECRALYAGGPRLLADAKVLKRLFPAHMFEDSGVYAERLKRAHYYAYPGTICEELLAGLSADPLRVDFGELDEHGDAQGDEWWTKFVTDVTGEASKLPGEDDEEGGCSMHHFAVCALREMLQTRHAWILADIAALPLDVPLATDADEIDAGLDDPYLCLVPAEQVVDWEYDDDGDALLWAMLLTERSIRTTPGGRRTLLRATYTLWDATGWAKYIVEYSPDQKPTMERLVPAADWGLHPFGRVPLERVELKEGMWAMGKLHSLAREHFNKRCAASWAEYKALFAVLYEFQGTEEGAVPVAQQDPDRATNQVRGQGYTQVRGKDDSAAFVGPDTAPFTEARESCAETMREMHRVMYSMAQSADMDSQAKARSGVSKQADKSQTETILLAFGETMRKAVRRLLGVVALGRKEVVPPVRVHGLEKFDSIAVADAIEQAVEVFNGLPMASALFAQLLLERTYRQILGDSLTPDQLAKLREQIAEYASPEALAQGMLATAGAAAAAKAKGQADQLDENGDPIDPNADPAGDGAPPAKGGKAPPDRPIKSIPRPPGKGKGKR